MNSGAHILVVEDEESLANALQLNLKLEGYAVMLATTGNDGLHLFKAKNQSLHLVLLDVMLPGINGLELCRNFKQINPQVPVVFLTAKSQSSEKISGLKLGADDYIVKPFELEELLLRIANIIKRNPQKSPKLFVFRNGKMDFATFEIVTHQGEKITLSRREIGLLKLLTENENKVVSRDEIIEKLWDVNENASSRTIDNYILSFRKYFEPNPKEPCHFHSVRGVGYKFTIS